MICLPFLTSILAGWVRKKKKKLSSVSFGLPHFCFSEPCLTPITKTPLDSTHNQEENLKPQEKSFSQKRNCILHLYMLESAFNFLHGDLFYVLFWFASNPVFYCKKKGQFLLWGPWFDAQLNAASQLSFDISQWMGKVLTKFVFPSTDNNH